jgi:predicted dehydrogenase
MIRSAIVGCGKIADAHAWAISSLRDCRIVGVCDREALMARQLYQRFPVDRHFDDLLELLQKARPDVVHVTTPPQTHYKIAMVCLDHGCHVYLEKPFTCNTAEALELIDVADRRGLKLTVGHDDQFRHAARRMRELIRSGYLGSPPLHMESYYGYEIGAGGYAKALLSDRQHWIRSLPGGLLQNVISHGIARIAEHMSSDEPRVLTHGFVSSSLVCQGERELIDELRVIIVDDDGRTAYFTFSSQMRPSLHQFRVFGARNGLLIDQDMEVLIRLRGTRRKSYLEQFVTPASLAREYFANSVTNIRRFAARDFHSKAGMKYLIDAFYASIRDGAALPVPYSEIVRTSRIMDSVFRQLGTGQGEGASGRRDHVPADCLVGRSP